MLLQQHMPLFTRYTYWYQQFNVRNQIEYSLKTSFLHRINFCSCEIRLPKRMSIGIIFLLLFLPLSSDKADFKIFISLIS